MKRLHPPLEMVIFLACCLLLSIHLNNAEELELKCHNGTGRCFWIDTGTQNAFGKARDRCQSAGGDLAVMETQELWNFFISNFE